MHFISHTSHVIIGFRVNDYFSTNYRYQCIFYSPFKKKPPDLINHALVMVDIFFSVITDIPNSDDFQFMLE